MKEAGLVGRQKRRYKIRTTDSNHDQPIAPNRLSDTPVIKSPDRVWVTDITYIQTNEGWLYVAGVLDRFSRKIVGWAMDSTLHTNLPLNALKMAINRRQPKPGILHHSDRSVQYASKEYRSVLDQYGLVASMSRKGNCYDNAAMESFWSTLKHELIFRKNFATRDEAKAAIFDYIEGFYNKTRLHSALGYKSPLDYELTNNYINN
jgi:transposase InsO family protein